MCWIDLERMKTPLRWRCCRLTEFAHSDAKNSWELFCLFCFEGARVGNKDHWNLQLIQFLYGRFGNSDEIGSFGNHTINVKQTSEVRLQGREDETIQSPCLTDRYHFHLVEWWSRLLSNDFFRPYLYRMGTCQYNKIKGVCICLLNDFERGERKEEREEKNNREAQKTRKWSNWSVAVGEIQLIRTCIMPSRWHEHI